MSWIDALAVGLQARLRALASSKRIGQFVSVGVGGATLETIVVFLLTGLFGAPALAAKAVGAEASISLMFLLNDRFTFGAEGRDTRRAKVRRYLKSHTVRIGGLAVAFGTLYALVNLTSIELVVYGLPLWPTVANGIGIGVGMVINYVAESLFTWRVHTN
ncbi:MAG: GtrA family protein [Halodesulfurarchaeum sp.]